MERGAQEYMKREAECVLTLGLATDERRALEALESVASVTPIVAADVPERLTRHRPGCVILSHDPPAIECLGTLETVVEAAPETPVVLYATAEDDGLAADALAMGATGYVPRRRGENALREAVETAIEVTERRRRRERDRSILDAILTRAPFEIYVKDVGARHLRSTKTAQFDDVEGKTEVEYFEGERAREIYDEDCWVIEHEEPIVEELHRYEVTDYDIDDHDSGWIRTSKYPWYEDGELRGLVGFTQDVTGVEETRRELTETNELLEQFASVVSHDLRNPLNMANGHLQMAREYGHVDAFDVIDESHTRMNEIIDDLVRLTRDNDLESALSPVEIVTEARHAWSTAGSLSATLRVETGPTVILAHGGLLQQVFENLFRNAIEHGREDVTVTVEREESGFSVSDDGPGLPSSVKEALNAGEFNSGGLGLNIVRTIVDKHGWGLTVGESPTGGARFSFTGCRLVTNPSCKTTRRRPQELTDACAIGTIAGGESERTGNTWTVRGTGRNLWRTVNELHYTFGTVDGDADLVARVTDFVARHDAAKAGLMIRTDLDPESPHGFVGCTNRCGSEVLWQLETAAGTQAHRVNDGVAPPQWYRIRREGDTVTTFISEDRIEWEPLDEQCLPLGERALYGLAVTSHDGEECATATFEDVTLDAVTWE